MWGALYDERTGLSFTMYNVQFIYILHVILLRLADESHIGFARTP
jgi:hypothetical protein